MSAPRETDPEPPKRPPLSGAALVGIGILSSRLLGIVRDMLRAAYLGATQSFVGDAWTVAIRIPNLLQNLLGEGVLSAAFIPVYSRLLKSGEDEEAGRLAGAIGAILALITAVLVAIGVVFAPQIVHLLAPKFTGEKLALTVQLTRILFPGAGLFVLAAWCIGILNSHRRFLLPYLAPVFWNLAMIAAFLWFGPRYSELERLAVAVAWASVVGAALQFLVQMPSVLRLAKGLRIRLDHRRASVRQVLTNVVPVGISRGIVQISQFIDLWIANQLPQGSVTLLMTAQTVAMLPVSLFGMAVSVAELPELSSVVGSETERAELLRRRISGAVRRIAFFVVPSAVAFMLFGDVIIRALFERRNWTPADTRYAWGILAGSAFGLLASTIGRLYSAAFYAMHDTARPLRFSLIRIGISIVLGYLSAVYLPPLLGIDGHWGAAALTLTSGIAGWVEFALLRRELKRRVGEISLPGDYLARVWAIAVGAAIVGLTIKWSTRSFFGLDSTLGHWAAPLAAAAVLGAFGVTYLAMATALRVPEGEALARRLLRR